MRRGGDPPSLQEVWRDLRADFDSVTDSRFVRTRTALGGTADAHLTGQRYWTLREYCRDAVRNDPILGPAVRRAADNVVQSGLTPEPQTGDRALDLELWARWTDWADDRARCDVRGLSSFGGIQHLHGELQVG